MLQASLLQFSAYPLTLARPATWKKTLNGMMSGAGGTVKAATFRNSSP